MSAEHPHLILIYCRGADLSLLQDAAQAAAEAVRPHEDAVAQRDSFVRAFPAADPPIDLWACSLLADEELRVELSNQIGARYASLTHPVPVVRLVAATGRLAEDADGNPVRYTVTSAGFGGLNGPGIGAEWGRDAIRDAARTAVGS